jgi:hypothetical protein
MQPWQTFRCIKPHLVAFLHVWPPGGQQASSVLMMCAGFSKRCAENGIFEAFWATGPYKTGAKCYQFDS